MSDDGRSWKAPVVMAAIVGAIATVSVAVIETLPDLLSGVEAGSGASSRAAEVSAGQARDIAGSTLSSSSEMALRLVPDLSGHLWKYPTGSASQLNTAFDTYKAGVTHTEDMPPAGESVAVFTFDLSGVRDRLVEDAFLDLQVDELVGDPFGRLGAMIVTEVAIGRLQDALDAEPVQVLARYEDAPARPLDVTRELRTVLSDGSRYFQVRSRFANVYLPNVELAIQAPNAYVEWNVGGRLTVRVR